MNQETKYAKSVIDRLSTVVQIETDEESHALAVERMESDTPDVEEDFEELLAQVISTLPVDDVRFDETLVKANLEEILLVFVGMHGETNGKELLSDLSQQFDADLSPGTVYPNLHRLEDENLLAVRPMVRTKEYSIEDQDAVRTTIEQTMIQHLALGLLFYAALPQFQSGA